MRYPGVLTEAGSQALLRRAIAEDQRLGCDRIVAVFCERAGWHFGCDEHKAAPDDVRACVDGHEALAYRPREPSGANRHEFPAMVARLQQLLGVGVAGASTHVDVAELERAARQRDERRGTQPSTQRAAAEQIEALQLQLAAVERRHAAEVTELRRQLAEAC